MSITIDPQPKEWIRASEVYGSFDICIVEDPEVPGNAPAFSLAIWPLGRQEPVRVSSGRHISLIGPILEELGDAASPGALLPSLIGLFSEIVMREHGDYRERFCEMFAETLRERMATR